MPDAIAVDRFTLMNLRQDWIVDGSPESPPLLRYLSNCTDPDQFSIHTNVYNVNGQVFHSLFAMNDAKFEGKGILIISKDGKVAWLSKKTGLTPVP